jgi:transcription antitermination factor NusG
MIESKKWYAVYTRPRWEKKVSEILTRKKIENYCPINKVVRQWSDRKKIVDEPLFTSYVFVRVPDNEIYAIKRTNGVTSLVYWLGKPAVIRDNEIEAIKRFLKEHENIKLEKRPIHIHDKIKVVAGPLMEMEGQVLSIKSKTVKMALPSLGYMMYAEVERTNVEVVKHIITEKEDIHYQLSYGTQ